MAPIPKTSFEEVDLIHGEAPEQYPFDGLEDDLQPHGAGEAVAVEHQADADGEDASDDEPEPLGIRTDAIEGESTGSWGNVKTSSPSRPAREAWLLS
jgi:hypothetical protein